MPADLSTDTREFMRAKGLDVHDPNLFTQFYNTLAVNPQLRPSYAGLSGPQLPQPDYSAVREPITRQSRGNGGSQGGSVQGQASTTPSRPYRMSPTEETLFDRAVEGQIEPYEGDVSASPTTTPPPIPPVNRSNSGGSTTQQPSVGSPVSGPATPNAPTVSTNPAREALDARPGLGDILGQLNGPDILDFAMRTGDAALDFFGPSGGEGLVPDAVLGNAISLQPGDAPITDAQAEYFNADNLPQGQATPLGDVTRSTLQGQQQSQYVGTTPTTAQELMQIIVQPNVPDDVKIQAVLHLLRTNPNEYDAYSNMQGARTEGALGIADRVSEIMGAPYLR